MISLHANLHDQVHGDLETGIQERMIWFEKRDCEGSLAVKERRSTGITGMS